MAALAAHAAAGGVTPLEYMLAILRNPRAKQKRRDWAAKESAPYLHPRLSSVDQTQKGPPTVVQKVYQFPPGEKPRTLPPPAPTAALPAPASTLKAVK